MNLFRAQGGSVAGLAPLIALLALIANLVSPAGYMIARQGDSLGLAICTGHGALILDTARADHASHNKGAAHHEDRCPFAGHGLASGPPPLMRLAAVQRVSRPWTPSPLPADLAPGRGLAAPPPPSQAPPTLS
jgi:hypothetical protein